MDITKVSNGKYTISLPEKFDFSQVASFRDCSDKIEKPGLSMVVIDFSKTRYMDSSALGMLLNLHNSYGGGGVEIHLNHSNDKINKILKISRFDTKFTIN